MDRDTEHNKNNVGDLDLAKQVGLIEVIMSRNIKIGPAEQTEGENVRGISVKKNDMGWYMLEVTSDSQGEGGIRRYRLNVDKKGNVEGFNESGFLQLNQQQKAVLQGMINRAS